MLPALSAGPRPHVHTGSHCRAVTAVSGSRSPSSRGRACPIWNLHFPLDQGRSSLTLLFSPKSPNFLFLTFSTSSTSLLPHPFKLAGNLEVNLPLLASGSSLRSLSISRQARSVLGIYLCNGLHIKQVRPTSLWLVQVYSLCSFHRYVAITS